MIFSFFIRIFKFFISVKIPFQGTKWNFTDSQIKIINTQLKQEYDELLTYPIINKIINNKFGVNIGSLIMEYLKCIEMDKHNA